MTDGENARAELDADARDALVRYVAAVNARDDATEAYDKARSDLLNFMALREAKVGTVDGAPVVSVVSYDRESFDTGRFKADQPYEYRKYTRLTHVEKLSLLPAARRQ